MKYNHHSNKRYDDVQVLNNNNNNNDDDDEFYRDLQKAKIKNFGGTLPPQQLRESAIQAEDDFLTAMKETKKDFQKIKNELGSDGAVDIFLERIRKEEEENDDDDDDDDDEREEQI
jgi:hypothetical protein